MTDFILTDTDVIPTQMQAYYYVPQISTFIKTR